MFVSADHRGFPISKRRVAATWATSCAGRQVERLAWIAARTPLAHIAYMGDSFTDIPVLRAVGVGITTADALPGVQRAATYVTQRRGGDRPSRRRASTFRASSLGRAEWAGIV